MLFGSELFEEYIGQLAMASMASLDIFTEGEQFDTKKVQEQMRVKSLSRPTAAEYVFLEICVTILLASLLVPAL